MLKGLSWGGNGASRGRDEGRYAFVEERLAGALAGVDPDAPQPVKTAALGAALCELGPAYRLFGRALSNRLDLLPEPVCRVLAALPAECPPLAPEAVVARVEAALGRPVGELFQRIAEQPHRSLLTHQESRVLLASGEAAILRLSRDDLTITVEEERDALPAVLAALAPNIDLEGRVAAVDALRATLAGLADSTTVVAGLRGWGSDASPRPLTPAFFTGYCAPGVTTRESLEGTTLASLVVAAGRAAGNPELARKLCRHWLAQALFGGLYPTHFTGSDVVVSSQGKVGWVGGHFAGLPATSRPRLWSYLQAAAAQDPDAAAAALLLELRGGPHDDGRTLVQRLRQGVPFRDAGLGARDDLAGYLFLHWRAATRLGYRPRPPLLAFWRGLAIVARFARALAPGEDGLRAAIDRLRLTSRVGEVVDGFAMGEFQSLATDALITLLDLPGKLDRALSLAAEGKVTLTLQSAPPPVGEARLRDGSQAVTAVLLAIAAVVIAARYLEQSSLGGGWLEPVATGVVVVLALILLRQLSWLWRARR